MALLEAVVIALVSLVITPGYLFYFDVTPKIVVLLAGTGILLFGAGRRPARFRSLLTLFAALLVLNVVSLTVSSALSANPALSVYGTNWRRFGALVQTTAFLFAWFVAVHTTGRRDRVVTVLRGVAMAGIPAALYGIVQYFGWDPILPREAYHVGEGIWTIVRPPGTLGYGSYFATWLLLTAILSLALVRMDTHRTWRRIGLSAAALALVAMFLTGTRAAMLGLVAGGVTWLWWDGFRISRKIAAIAAVALLACAGFYFSPPGRQLRSRTRWFTEDPHGGARPELWRDSLRMAAQHPLAGYGPEVFTATFPHYESKELARAYPNFAHESPHNILLDALVAQGIPGFLLLCALCGTGLLACRKANCPALAAALLAGIVCQQFTVFTAPTAVIFYTTLALSVGLASEPAVPRKSPLIAMAATAAGIVLLYFAARFLVADHALALARLGVESGDERAAALQYQRYGRWRLPGSSADLWYSRASIRLAQNTSVPLVRLQALAQSGTAALRATETSEDPFNAWYNVAALYASQNDAAGAERSLRSAIAAHPNWFKPHWTLAQVLQVEGRTEDAEREARLAADLNGGKNPEVALTLKRISSH
jgi:O-antigen ligase